MRISCAVWAALSCVIAPAFAIAQWVPNGSPVCTAPSGQTEPVAAPDGAHGAIIAWPDHRDGHWDIYAQRINVAGVRAWGLDGVPVCTARGDKGSLDVTADGAGGAIVVWRDYRCGSHIFAQRLGSSGQSLWTPDGVNVSTFDGCQLEPGIASDGAGGVIVAWVDCGGHVYAQRVDATGALKWNPAGVSIAAWVYDFAIAADGAGGAAIAYSTGNIYTQRIDPTGAKVWASDVPVCTGTNYSLRAAVVSDGAGGDLVAWADNRSGNTYNIFAQRVGANGAPQWATNGVALCISPIGQDYPTMVTDGSHGAMVTWKHLRSGTGFDVYANHVTGDGAVAWTNGYPICFANGDQVDARIATDGSGGAIITWQDHRGTDWDIYAANLTQSGLNWGIALCNLAGDQFWPAIVSDGLGGAIVAWADARNSPDNDDIYAQRVDATGHAPATVGVGPLKPAAFRLLPPVPNPAQGSTTIAFELPSTEEVTVDVFDILGERVRRLIEPQRLAPGLHSAIWDSRNARTARVANGIYFVHVRAGKEVARCKIVVAR